MNTPNPILPAPTPENAITMQMQFQIEILKRLDQINLSLQRIGQGIERVESKKP